MEASRRRRLPNKPDCYCRMAISSQLLVRVAAGGSTVVPPLLVRVAALGRFSD